MIDLGDQIRLTVTITDSTGAFADSTITLSITLPDQTTAGPFTPVHDSTGKYHYDYLTVQAGRHVAHWVGVDVAFAHTEVFDAEPAADISIVSLDDMKTQLRITGTADDDEIRSYILSASENIEGMVGACAVRSFTEQIGGGDGLALTAGPILSLTSIIPVYPWLMGIDVGDLTFNPDSGVVTTLSGIFFAGPYTVGYQAGRPVIPSSIRTACRLIVQHLWETKRGQSSVPQYGGEETVTLPGWGYAIPNRAAELLQRFPAAAGFA